MDSKQQKWMSNLVIVRHGESERNVSKVAATDAGLFEYGGEVRDVDVQLTVRGQAQAKETGKHLARKLRFDRVFTSPYLRTIQTTQLMVREFENVPEIVSEERIREKEFGILDGLTKKGIDRKYPEEAKRKQLVGKYYYRPPGGESYPDVCLRIHSFLGTLTRDFACRSVLAVCHSVIVLAFRRLLERLSESDLLAIDGNPDQEVRNCSVTWYAFDLAAGANGKLVLKQFNRVYY
jgi:2,3-bisphosphoglycerate-dependent phosphoglycerate mutase